MSRKHPIIAVTGSSGSGTTTVKESFEHMFRREGIKPAIVEGDSFHRFNRADMKKAMAEAEKTGQRT
ncbi:MAG: phosphoribulokinase, partial [Rhodospirillaceae bacterium]|nr:phosphoribulokinase [Rhodospirillales bacterium]